MVSSTVNDSWFELLGGEMTDESTEQKRQKIVESFEREQTYFEKAFEENAERLNKFAETNNLAGIDQAKKNMGEASEILGDLVKQKNEALRELQAAETAAQTIKEASIDQEISKDTLDGKKEEREKSEEEDYNYGYGM
jgi:CHASE3 domain sensor protein